MSTAPTEKRETYLGDGLYARFDGYSIILRAPREPGVDHWVALEPAVLEAFDRFREEIGDPLSRAQFFGK